MLEQERITEGFRVGKLDFSLKVIFNITRMIPVKESSLAYRA